jgi:hypothetical protein
MSALVPIDNSKIRTGPGVIYFAPIGSDLPPMVAAASSYAADVWPVAWLKVGPTDSGFERSSAISTDGVEVEEDLEPVRFEITGQTNTVSFTLVEDTLQTLKLAMNGGTTLASGSGATLSTKFSPPLLGAQNSVMIGWQSDDSKIREIYYSCLQTGSVTPARRKGSAKTVYSLEFSVQKPDPAVSSVSWNRWVAGTAA